MSIKGFNVNGVTEQYDYNSLDNIPDIQGIPTGGTEGQVLAKTSGADYAVGWVNQTGGGGGGGSETDEIFWVTRNVTTFAEVQKAVANGKLCVYKNYGTILKNCYYLFYINDQFAAFGNFSVATNGVLYMYCLYSSNSWTYQSITIPEVLTFDTTPKQYSNNPVRSYGIWNAINNLNAVSYASQELTSSQKQQARDNIGAASVADAGTAFTIKGDVATVNDLPSSGNAVGDVWFVQSVSAAFVWLKTTAHPDGYWEEFGEPIDMEAYIEKPASASAGQFLAYDGSDWGAKTLAEEVTVSTAGAVTQALDAGKIYHFTGALTALTITLNAPASGDLAQYHFDFLSGSTAPTLTMPNTVTMPDSFSVEANRRYEIDVLNNYGAVAAWAT